MSGQCAVRVFSGKAGASPRGWLCTKPAKVDEDGQMRCSTHSIAAQRKRDEKYRARLNAQFEQMDRNRALHSAEREVLEACVEEDRLWVEYEAGWNSVGKYDSARDARIAAVRRYRALLDGKEAK